VVVCQVITISAQTEYREGFFQCADCRVALVHELPPAESPPDTEPEPEPIDPPFGAELVAVFTSGDVYTFLDAANALRRARVPFIGDAEFTGEFRPHRRAQAAYQRTLLVAVEHEDQALRALAQMAGEV
jgi:hypothetical protein